MNEQSVEPKRISEDPDNYEQVFRSARSTADGVRDGSMEPSEATAIARNEAVAQRALDGDLKSRLVDARLRRVNAPQLPGRTGA